MKYVVKAFKFITGSTAITGTGLSVLVPTILVGMFVAHAASTYDLHNVPDMKLVVRIDATQTNKITMGWPTRNSVKVPYPTTTGGVLEFKQGTRTEHIYFSRAINNFTNKTFTLTGTIIRDLSWNDCSGYISNNAGQIFYPGADVREVDDCRQFNFSVHKDRSNILTASGAISFTGSGSLGQPTYATTAARDQALGANPVGPVRVACVIATGLCYDYIGGSWVARTGGGGDPNATEAIAGKVELGSVKDQSGATITGDTGAATVVQTRYLTQTGSTTNKYGRIGILTKVGIYTGSLLGLGNQYANGGKTHLSGTGAWVADAPVGNVFFAYETATGSAVFTDSTEHTVNNQYSLTGALISTGTVLEFNAFGNMTNIGGSNTLQLRFYIGGTAILVPAVMTPVNNTRFRWEANVTIRFRKIGANAQLLANGVFQSASTGSTTRSPVSYGSALGGPPTIDLTANPKISFSLQNANGSASNTSQLEYIFIKKYINAQAIR